MVLLELLFKLLIGHAFGDYAFQTHRISRYKDKYNKSVYNKKSTIEKPTWLFALTAHALIHGGIIWFITGIPFLGLAEVCTHWLIDCAHIERKLSLKQDQFLHFLCKLLYVGWVMTA